MAEEWTDPSGSPIEFYLYVLPVYVLLLGLAITVLVWSDEWERRRWSRRAGILAVTGVVIAAGLVSLAGLIGGLRVGAI